MKRRTLAQAASEIRELNGEINRLKSLLFEAETRMQRAEKESMQAQERVRVQCGKCAELDSLKDRFFAMFDAYMLRVDR
jgi:outer membrane murein-binding lipoprotein Lpp